MNNKIKSEATRKFIAFYNSNNLETFKKWLNEEFGKRGYKKELEIFRNLDNYLMMKTLDKNFSLDLKNKSLKIRDFRKQAVLNVSNIENINDKLAAQLVKVMLHDSETVPFKFDLESVEEFETQIINEEV